MRSKERITDEQMDEIVDNLSQIPVFGPLDTEDRDAAINLIDQLRAELTLAEQQRDAAVEGLEDDIEEIEPAIYILETSPKECLGITGDDSNSWPIRDELISHLKKRVKEDRDTLARIREMGEKEGSHD